VKGQLSKKFFERRTLVVARELLGKYLVRRVRRHRGYTAIKEKITEVEAYVGPHDLACHSSRGRTKRNGPMYAKAGTIYIYFTYGMHWMLNIVTERKDFPAAVLIRGTENYKGPGILTRELKIDKKLNGKMLGKKSGLWITESSGASGEVGKIRRLPRVGVAYAGPIWSQKKYRFGLEK
jgi:DNA-3-methyladenine glycosylase